MEWIEIDKNNIYECGEVLAANFNEGSYGFKDKIVGYLYIDDCGIVCCAAHSEVLENCTHYIILSKFDIC